MTRSWRKEPRNGLTALALMGVVALLWAARVPSCRGLPPVPQGMDLRERVARAEDGDTISLTDGREVRYLGIDTPERGEPHADEAREANRKLVAGKLVGLRRGGPDATDRYGRLLRAVYVQDPSGAEGRPLVCVNVALVRAGLAMTYVAGNDALEPWLLAELLAAQKEAIAARRKRWREVLDPGKDRSGLVSSRWRIHRLDCREIANHRLGAVTSLEKELSAGKSPCRSCGPLR